jgi:hypothetical protein
MRNQPSCKLVIALLEAGADPSTATQDKWIPGIAVDARDWTLLELLVEFGLTAESEGQGTTLAEYIRHSDSPGMLAVVTPKVPAP